MSTNFFLKGFCLLLLAGIFGCAAPSGEQSGGEDLYYLNANLGFAIEHPADWLRIKAGADPTEVKWSGPTDKKRRQPPSLIVSVYPSSGKAVDAIEKIFLASHLGLIVTAREDVELPAAAGRQLLGEFSGLDFLVYLLAADQGAYILEFSALSEDFAADRATFETMAKSFRILAPQTALEPFASGK